MRGEMVRAILEGRKTQTRRIIKPQPINRAICATNSMWYDADHLTPGRLIKPKYGAPSDRLWVRETFSMQPKSWAGDKLHYRADSEPDDVCLWTPSIFMPRRASRITLEIVAVRVERLHEITQADAKAEGSMPDYAHRCADLGHPYDAMWLYAKLWDSINAKTHPWSSNPWVWVIEFKRV